MTDRRLLMIPGPIEIEPAVTSALGQKTRGHLDPAFMQDQGDALRLLREVAGADACFPFTVAGSGTLAMEMAVANLVEPGTKVLVVHTGWFGDRMAEIVSRHGGVATQLRAPIGEAPTPGELTEALAKDRYDVVTVTHVDTSTGVRAELEGLAKAAKAAGALVVVDAVCSLGAERLEQDAWGIDVVLAGSQKALGAPPGLAVLTVSQAALAAHAKRTRKPASLYADWAEWMPIMEAYMASKPSYFATPATNLVSALATSLRSVAKEGRIPRAARHERLAKGLRAGLSALGLNFLPQRDVLAASTLTAVSYPQGIDQALVGAVKDRGVLIAGGLHPEIKTRYFRVGHMGAVSENDVVAVQRAVGDALASLGHACDPGAGLAALTKALA